MGFLHSGGLVYRGNVTSLQQLEGSTLMIDDYGLDEETVSFGGVPTLLKDFLLRYPPGTPDSQFIREPGMPSRNPGMFVVGRPNVTVGRAFAIATFKLVGKAGETPAPPLVRQRDSWREDTIQGQSAPLPLTIVQLIFDYRALSTTYEYSSMTRPDAPQYENGVRATGLGIQIIRKRGVVKFNDTDFGPLDASLIPQQRLAQFEITQEGLWWSIVETWEWALVQQRTYFIGKSVIVL